MENSRIILDDASLLDEQAKICVVRKKKEIKERSEYEAARATMAVVE